MRLFRKTVLYLGLADGAEYDRPDRPPRLRHALAFGALWGAAMLAIDVVLHDERFGPGSVLFWVGVSGGLYALGAHWFARRQWANSLSGGRDSWD